MYCVYVLYSRVFDEIYIGQTKDLIARFHSHNVFSSKGYTKRYRPWVVAYVEFFNERSFAMSREKALKSSRGRNWVWLNLDKKAGFISVS